MVQGGRAEAFGGGVNVKMMPAEISAGLKSGRLKEITLTQAECCSRNEQFLQLMREDRLNIKAYWDAKERMVRFGVGQK